MAGTHCNTPEGTPPAEEIHEIALLFNLPELWFNSSLDFVRYSRILAINSLFLLQYWSWFLLLVIKRNLTNRRQPQPWVNG